MAYFLIKWEEPSFHQREPNNDEIFTEQSSPEIERLLEPRPCIIEPERIQLHSTLICRGLGLAIHERSWSILTASCWNNPLQMHTWVHFSQILTETHFKIAATSQDQTTINFFNTSVTGTANDCEVGVTCNFPSVRPRHAHSNGIDLQRHWAWCAICKWGMSRRTYKQGGTRREWSQKGVSTASTPSRVFSLQYH